MFDGGNDDPVRRVEGVTILSVGEKEDPGVIDGGVQVDANHYWMETLMSKLDNGKPWPDILQALPEDALSVRIRNKIDLEKCYAYKFSEWHADTSKKISTDLLVELYVKYGDVYKQTRESLLKVKRTQYELVTRLSILKKYHYDNARKIVMQLIADHPSVAENDAIKNKLKQYLLPEISSLLKTLLVDHLRINEHLVSNKFDEADDNYYHEVPAEDHFYMGTQCFHCDNPPCVEVCPVQATWKEKDGLVVIDYDWCVGCRYCMAACPYDGRRFNWSKPEVPEAEVNKNQHYLGNRMRKKGVMEKCTFCVQRTRKGKNPACVEACPTGARIFGNLLDPKSTIRWVLENKKVFRLKEDLGTDPKFWYFMD